MKECRSLVVVLESSTDYYLDEACEATGDLK